MKLRAEELHPPMLEDHTKLSQPVKRLSYFLQLCIKGQSSKLKFLLGRHLATNSFALGRLFYKSTSKILGAMATKMVATWRVVFVWFLFIISNVTTVSVE